MNKNEFISEVTNRAGLTKKDCKLCLDTILAVIKDVLKEGDSVTFSNFGKFKTNEIKAKPMYNFATKQTRIMHARKTPAFKASEKLKKSI